MYEIEQDLDRTFLASSKELIFALNVNVYGYTYIAGFSIPSGVGIPRTALTTSLLDTFEDDDLRRSKWIGSTVISGTTYNYSHKYKISSGVGNNSEKEVVLRIGETYLIRKYR